MRIEGRSDCITNATQEELYLKILFLSKLKKKKTPQHPGIREGYKANKSFLYSYSEIRW